MAKQHFYSRVPARVSMYNRADGFDTFAHSEGLDREFVERELSAVYENKLSKNDMEAVRKGLMPVVYSQYCLRCGSLVQSCIRYLPKDYTGERSAYLCHTLIPSDYERALLSSKGNAPLNPDMFTTDVTVFDFMSPEAKADPCYPEKDYVPSAAGDPKVLIGKYDPETLKSFLFAFLSVLCAKGKNIYFKLPCSDEGVSAEALELISLVTAVIPYHLRKGISFVTYVTDPAQHAQVKIKAVSEHCPEIPAAKGVFLDFGTGLVTGMPGADIVAKAPVSFFYSLLEDAAVRDEFLLFIHKAVQTVPSLEKLNMKTLSDLVFLFGGASGLFPQETVLPADENVYELFCIYEKYRAALGEEYRRNVYKCLERYPQRHTAIPKNIFTKLSRLYPSEVHCAKRIAMNTVLELIHTDIMRDKLFTFVKNNYDGEDADIRAVINADLCRVFYGGFLQPQILSFFSEHFSQEPEGTQNAVFEKLMLTIRTEAVQPKILEFMENNYENLSDGQKEHFYKTFFEMLPECDALSQQLICFVNGRIENETEQRKQEIAAELARLLENDSRKKEHRLLPMLCREPGFCCDTVIRLVFGQWSTRKIFDEYLELLSRKTVRVKTEELFHILDLVSNMEESAQGKLITPLEQLYADNPVGTDLYDWLEADAIAEQKLAEGNNAFACLFRVKVTQPAITNALTDVFDSKLRRDGLEVISRYAQSNMDIADTEQYKPIKIYLQLENAVKKNDVKTVFGCLKALPEDAVLRANMAGYIKACLLNQQTQNAEQTMLCVMSIHYLTNGTLVSETVYQTCKEHFIQQQYALQGQKANVTKAAREGVCSAAEWILNTLITACKTGTVFAEAICADREGLDAFLSGFSADYGKGAHKWVISHVAQAPAELMAVIRGSLDGIKLQTVSLWSKLFKKQ